jgi:virginiamycin A acetyltransferase
VHIACAASVEIGPEVSSSDFATITDSWALFTGPVRTVPPPPPAPVVVERGAYLGFGSIVGPGVRVGEGAFVGEQAVVVNDVAPHSVVYGNPAVEVRRYEAVTGEWIGPRFP